MNPEIQIVPFSPDLADEFKAINLPWVEGLFSVEPFDQAQFDAPEETIIKPGGVIIFAKLNDEILGTVALYKSTDSTFEMIKMGVKPEAQGKGIGMALAKEIIRIAKEMGGQKLVLYSNTKLEAALQLYHKLGFKSVVPEEGKYCRCDVKMELFL